MHPREIEEKISDARQDGIAFGIRINDEQRQRALDEMKDVRRMLWAVLKTVGSVRVQRKTLHVVPGYQTAAIKVYEDPATEEIVLVAID